MDKLTLLPKAVLVARAIDGTNMAVISTKNEYNMPIVVLYEGDRPTEGNGTLDSIGSVLKFSHPDVWKWDLEGLKEAGLNLEEV
jgi:hypothetical protein